MRQQPDDVLLVEQLRLLEQKKDEAREILDRGRESDEVLGLFGTDTVPLPWRSSAPPESVVAELRLLNPDARVIAP